VFATLNISTITTILVVVIHYEFLSLAVRCLKSLGVSNQRRSIVVILLAAVLAHVVEIWCFAFAYFGLLQVDGVGGVSGFSANSDMLDYAYFSFVSYTTLGFGEIVPTGFVRFLSGTEALVGLVLITWTASFLFMQMEKNWQD
jgi:hypothetical protein